MKNYFKKQWVLLLVILMISSISLALANQPESVAKEVLGQPAGTAGHKLNESEKPLGTRGHPQP